MPKIQSNFSKLDKEIQVKYDLLTEQVLKDVSKFGSRVLHLSSDMFHKDYLYVEGNIGMCKRMRVENLKEFFQNLNIEHLPVDVVVLAIPDSTKIG